MSFKEITTITAIVILAFITGACGTSDDSAPFVISGKITIDESIPWTGQPLVVYIAKGSAASLNTDDAADSTLALVNVNNQDQTFSIDLSEKNLKRGDIVSIIAFIDNNYNDNLPTPDRGDYLGFYIDQDALSTDFIISDGEMNAGTIHINRQVFSFQKSISGTITNTYDGDVLLIAYAGEINSMDFDSLRFEDIIGYNKIVKRDAVAEYELPVMPYGYNLPIKDVYVLALFDTNGNGQSDSGDFIDFYRGEAGGDIPELITLDAGEESGKNINFTTIMEVTDPSEDKISVSGTIRLPENYQTLPEEKPVFIIAAKADTPDAVMASVSDIKYFEKLSLTDASEGLLDYKIDLSETDLVNGETVMMIALLDIDYQSGFPEVTKGDQIGFYTSPETLSTLCSLSEETTGIDISISREVYDFSKTVTGTLNGAYTGDVLLVAYDGEINSLNFTSFDPDHVKGYQKITKTEAVQSYELPVLPYGSDLPMENLYIFALCDTNGNGLTDPGDLIGYYTGAKGPMPELLTLTSAPESGSNIDIDHFVEIALPSPDPITLEGRITLSDPYRPGTPEKPFYIIVSESTSGGDPAASFDSVRYFERLTPPETGNESFDYRIDLSKSGLACGDEITVAVLWDLDYTNGFPDPTRGDIIGFYINAAEMSAGYKLSCGTNTDADILLNRTVYDFDKSITGTITGDYTGPVTIVAYTGNIDSMDFDTLDFDKIIAWGTFEKSETALDYSLKIIPFGVTLPVKNVYILAFFDTNKSGVVDNTDFIGFYTGSKNGIPELIEITNANSSGTDIDLGPLFQVTSPSPDTIQLEGTIRLSEAPDDTGLQKPVFIVVTRGGSTGDISSAVSDILYFKKFDIQTITERSFDYSIDLSDTDLVAGEEIMVAAIWDLDYRAGFPELTPGDYIGLHYPQGAITSTIRPDENKNYGIDIFVSRKVWDYHTGISGSIIGPETGNVTIVAYSGEIISSDFADLDMDKIIGYRQLQKTEAVVDYTLDILPYGQNLPIENLFILAFIDGNGNNRVDGGDRIGFHMAPDSGLPNLITITETPLSGIDIAFAMDVSEPCGMAMSITGSFQAPIGYDASSPPFYIVILDGNDLESLTGGSMSSIRYFRKMPPGEFFYDLDLSGTGLCPGDTVMIAGLWDRDYDVGFPNPTRGDRLGIVQDKDEYSMMVPLKYGENIIPQGDYSFKIDKNVYEFDASIAYAIDMQYSGSWDTERSQLLIMTVHVDGVDVNFNSSGTMDVSVDMDYALGINIIKPVDFDYLGTEPERIDPDPYRKMNIFTALYKEIVVWEESDPSAMEPLIKGNDYGTENEATAYLVGILDKDGDFEIDSDDEIGYYGAQSEETGEFIFIPGVGMVPNPYPGVSYFLPEPVKRIVKGDNMENREDGSNGPYWIKMNAASNVVQE